MKSKPFNLLINLLYIFLAILFVILPAMFVIARGGLEGLALPMAAIGLWLLLFGRMKIGKLHMEGRQAFAVGGALFLPILISGAVHQMNLWPALALAVIIIGFVAAFVLYFLIKPTPVSKDRTLALIILSTGMALLLFGFAISKPADASGVISVNGLTFIPYV